MICLLRQPHGFEELEVLREDGEEKRFPISDEPSKGGRVVVLPRRRLSPGTTLRIDPAHVENEAHGLRAVPDRLQKVGQLPVEGLLAKETKLDGRANRVCSKEEVVRIVEHALRPLRQETHVFPTERTDPGRGQPIRERVRHGRRVEQVGLVARAEVFVERDLWIVGIPLADSQFVEGVTGVRPPPADS